MRKEKSEKNVGYNPVARFFLMLFFAVMAILILIPLYALLLGTFKGGAELFVSGLNLDPTPEKLHLRAWRYLFTGVMSNGEYQPHDYFIWYKNSFLLVLVQGTLTLLIPSMVAYGFSKYQFRGKNVLFLCVLLVMMIPLEILMLPMYTQINAMGLRDSYAGVMLPFLANMSAIFFFKQFLEGVPGDLLDAGRVDGCTEYGIFFKIIMPIMKPAYASMAVLVGMGAWNGLLWPLLVISSMKKYTIPLGLNTLFTPYGNNYDLMITGSCFAILPLLLLYLLGRGEKKRPLVPLGLGTAGLCAALVFQAASHTAGRLTVSVLDVGQGLSVALLSGGRAALVDCGGTGADNPGDTAADYFQSLGLSRIDLVEIGRAHV